ncbi:MAG: hypothetical protein PF692_05010 [Kiritimatiellae bacterium]|jgi:hypothetical protein|nr:hypothetical protein [Kiritimatiellia bacterium]
MKSKNKCGLCLVGAVLVGTMAHAGQLAYEGFNYSPPPEHPTWGVSLYSGANGGVGFAAQWYAGFGTEGYLNEARVGGMNYPGHLASTGNRAVLTAKEGLEPWSGAGQINYIHRALDVAGAFASYSDGTNIGADGTIVWGSFLYSGSDDAAQNPLRFQLNSDAAHVVNCILPGSTGTSLVVFKVVFGASNADTASFYVNPTLAFNPDSAVPSQTFTGNLAFLGIEFDIATRSGVAYNGSNIDEIRFGAEAKDVVPVAQLGTIIFVR